MANLPKGKYQEARNKSGYMELVFIPEGSRRGTSGILMSLDFENIVDVYGWSKSYGIVLHDELWKQNIKTASDYFKSGVHGKIKAAIKRIDKDITNRDAVYKGTMLIQTIRRLDNEQ